MQDARIKKRDFRFLFFVGLIPLLIQGCATRGWVGERIEPLAGRISDVEGQVGRFGERLSGVEGRLGQVDARANRALVSLSNLRLDRRLVMDLREGTNFAFDSAVLTEGAKRQISGFLSDVKGDLNEADGAIFVVAGHTDGIGSEQYNFELGKKRAESVARYLITQKKVDPTSVITVSYGKSAPMAENNNPEGRAKNRRVEVLVYREGITTASVAGEGEPRAGANRLEGSR